MGLVTLLQQSARAAFAAKDCVVPISDRKTASGFAMFPANCFGSYAVGRGLIFIAGIVASPQFRALWMQSWSMETDSQICVELFGRWITIWLNYFCNLCTSDFLIRIVVCDVSQPRHTAVESHGDGESAGMQVENISCNSCGAPLEVSTTTQFATCRHCGAKLSIQRTDTATFTEILEQLTAKTDQLSDQVQCLAEYTELAALDREWELERENYVVTGKHGRKHIPTEAGAIGGGIATTLFGCFWTVMAFSITSLAPSIGPFAIAKVGFPLFGLIAVVAGIVASLNAYFKASDYRRAEKEYRLRRAAIQRRTI